MKNQIKDNNHSSKNRELTEYWFDPDYINKTSQLLFRYINGDNVAGDTLDQLADWEITQDYFYEQMKLTGEKYI